jgi:hypothetical protein
VSVAWGRRARAIGLPTIHRMKLIFAAALALVSSVAAQTPSIQEAALRLGFDASAIGSAMRGQIVTRDLEASTNREIAVAGAAFIHAPIQRAEDWIRSGGSFKSDPRIAAVVELPGRDVQPTDLAALRLSEREMPEVRALLHAKAGPALNLSSEEGERFRALRPQVKGPEDQQDALAAGLVTDELRRVLAERANAYRASGLGGAAPYARGAREQTSPREELLSAAGAERLLAEGDTLRRASLTREAPDPGVEHHLFAIQSTVELRPEFELVHLMASKADGGFGFVERHFYASQSFNTVEITALFLPVQDGTFVLYSNRTSTDGLVGLGGDARKNIAQARLRDETARTLRDLTQHLTAEPPPPGADPDRNR